jgi:transcriptional regulator with GAF, ATPase, and Fis domain
MSNTIERAILVEESRLIRAESVSLPDIKRHSTAADPDEPIGLKLSVDQEREMILRALEETLWIQKDAAGRLGISPRALNYRVKKLGIAHHRWRKNK